MLHEYVPKPPLSHFVNQFWLWEGYHPPHPRERILPGGAMEMLFFLADEQPLRVYYPNAPDEAHTFRGPVVAGIRSEHFLVDTRQPATILGVWFKPGGGLPFFKADAHELHNLHVSLDVLWRAQESNDLYEQIREAPTPMARFRILEQAMCAKLAEASPYHRAVGYALHAFNCAPQSQTVSQVIDEIGISPRRFIQVFSEQVGLTPKLYCRVQRFQEAIRLIARRDSISWVDIALTTGYYDQAHFIKDFQDLAGIRPTLYRPQSKEHVGNLAVLE